jgi:hypothetical protein
MTEETIPYNNSTTRNQTSPHPIGTTATLNQQTRPTTPANQDTIQKSTNKHYNNNENNRTRRTNTSIIQTSMANNDTYQETTQQMEQASKGKTNEGRETQYQQGRIINTDDTPIQQFATQRTTTRSKDKTHQENINYTNIREELPIPQQIQQTIPQYDTTPNKRNEAWGASINRLPPTTFRIYFQNINGLQFKPKQETKNGINTLSS